MDLGQQYATMLLMLMAGAMLGVVYDIYRTSLKAWVFLRRFSVILDLSFWIFGVVFVFTMLLGANHGDVRLVVFVLLAVGWWLYAMTLSKVVVAGTRQLLRMILTVFRFVFKLWWWMFVFPVISLGKLGWKALKIINRTLYKLEIILVWPIRTIGRRIIKLFKKKEDSNELTNKYRQKTSLKWKFRIRRNRRGS